MSYITLTNVVVLDNPTCFLNPFQFEVTFQCHHPLDDDLEWKLIYVGSPDNDAQDQALEEVLVGPVPIGTNRFVFQSNPPNPDLIPHENKLGVTVILITCSYKGQEFVRVGYYVNNELEGYNLDDGIPTYIDMNKVERHIMAEKPRVTRFPINWANPEKTNINNNISYDNDENWDPLGNNRHSLTDIMDEQDTMLINAAAQLDQEENQIVIGNDENQLTTDFMGLDDEDDDEDDEDDDMDENIEIDL